MKIKQFPGNTAFTRDAVRRIGCCDGSKTTETLKWLRLVSECNQDRLTVLHETSEGPLDEFIFT